MPDTASSHQNGAVAVAPTPKRRTTTERLDDLEARFTLLETQFRNFIASQMLKDPAVQRQLQQELVARLAAEGKG